MMKTWKEQNGNLRKPDWLKIRLPGGETYQDVKELVQRYKLHTVCEEARCPNIGHCWERKSATFLIMGDTCTRSCGFCAIKTGRPDALDPMEPLHVAEAIRILGLRHAVITSVNRDELPDGGAEHFARTIRATRKQTPETIIEVLIPDFEGSEEALRKVVEAKPDVINHNLETVERLYPQVRPQAKYWRSIELIRKVKEMDSTVGTKSGIMVGLGERDEEVLDLMMNLRYVDCDVITIGQYLRPTLDHLPVVEYVSPEKFTLYREKGLGMGFVDVASGPLVRSSFHAEDVFHRDAVLKRMKKKTKIENGLWKSEAGNGDGKIENSMNKTMKDFR
jgi:lipoic acid synthetase